MSGRTLVLGIGNVLAGDDGLGPHAIAALERGWEFSPSVELLDAGTPGPDLVVHIDGAESLIVIDALALDAEAGELHEYRKTALLDGALPFGTSSHRPTLRHALAFLELEGRAPESVYVVGLVPERLGVSTGLSECLQERMPELCAKVLAELERLGVTASPRA